MRYDARSLRALLPHRPPTLLVDSVDVDVDSRSAVGTKAITLSEPCFWQCDSRDSFDYPIGLLIESMGQTCAALWLALRDAAGDPPMGTLYFAKAEQISLDGRVGAGQTITHTVTLERTIADTAFMSGITHCGTTQLVTAGSLIAAGR